MQTNTQLQLASDFIRYTGQNVFLTGKAGTGKTTFLNTLREDTHKRLVVVAPTGVAAINAGGVTIHSFFQLSFAPQIGSELDQSKEQRFNKEKINIIRSIDLLVIDEISMVRVDVLDAIDRTLRRFRWGNKPFGGVQVLMIGDLQQLTPVVKNEEWGLLRRVYDTPYFFSSKVLREAPMVTIELQEVFRQQDDRFISILNKVRDNCLDEPSREILNERYDPNFIPRDEEGYITLCTHNVRANGINEDKLRKLDTGKHTYRATVEGKFPEYSYPTASELDLKPGAQVMFIKNDPDPEKRFFNGKIGHVTRVEEELVAVQCPGDDEEIEVSPLTWENVKYSIDKENAEIKEEVEGSFCQIPLKLAWAITIHKSQGLTFEKAIIDAETSFAHGQVYVALSRCKSLEGMVLLSRITSQSIITDRTVDGFIKDVEGNQPGNNELEKAKQAYQREQLFELFRFNRQTYLIQSMNRVMTENEGSFSEIQLEDFKKFADCFKKDISEVANKFHGRINGYLRTNPGVDANEELLERVQKAAGYFHIHLENIFAEVKTLDMDIDNRKVKTQLKNYWKDLQQEFSVKCAMFLASKEGYRTDDVLHVRARALMKESTLRSGTGKAKEVVDLKNVPHPELQSILRNYRMEKSSELGIPPYRIFSQKTLAELVSYLPADSRSLGLINGMGPKKMSDYGMDILQMIDHYCQENKVQRVEIPVESKKEKKVRIHTRQISYDLYRDGKSITEIAELRGLTSGTVAGHLAHYLKSGEIDINELVEKEKLITILKYFEKAESMGFRDAKEALGEACTYEEIRFAYNHYQFTIESKTETDLQ